MAVDNQLADADLYPWAIDIDGRWHRRQPGSGWERDEIAGGRVITVCGEAIWTCHVSEFDPVPFYRDVESCDYCKEAS